MVQVCLRLANSGQTVRLCCWFWHVVATFVIYLFTTYRYLSVDKVHVIDHKSCTSKVFHRPNDKRCRSAFYMYQSYSD